MSNNRSEKELPIQKEYDGRDQNGKPLRRILMRAAYLILVVLVIAGVIAIWQIFEWVDDVFLWTAVMIAFTGIYPLTYLAYRKFRAQAQRKRLKDDFRLLGLVSKETLDEDVDKLFQTAYSPIQFIVYIFLIMTLLILIFGAYLDRDRIGFVEPETVKLAFFGLLGAYLFSVQELVRRFNTFDLLPQVFSSIFARMMSAVVITFVGAFIITLTTENFNQYDSNMAWAAVLAFVIGIFPKWGTRWLIERTNSILMRARDPVNERSLENILGISAWHEARLEEMGIDDAQNLATADIRRLLLTTQFDAQEIVHWVDQAILYVKVGQSLDKYRAAGLATFSEFSQAVMDLSMSMQESLTKNEVGRREKARERLAAFLGLSSVDMLKRMADYSNYPNYVHIKQYYTRKPQVAQEWASIATQSLLGTDAISVTVGSIAIGSDKIGGRLDIAEYNRIVEKSMSLIEFKPDDPELWVGMAQAYYCLDNLPQAKNACDSAISLNDQLPEAYNTRGAVLVRLDRPEEAIRDFTAAIRINPLNARAFNNRGSAYFEINYKDQALKDFNRALELDELFSEPYLNRSALYNELEQYERANDGFEAAWYLGCRVPTLWIGWGIALIGLGENAKAQSDDEQAIKNFEAAVDKLSRAVIDVTDNSFLAKAFYNRGYAYMQLGENHYMQARQDLENAIIYDPQRENSYLILSDLEFAENNEEEALKHLEQALEINSDNYKIYYRLGDLKLKMNEFEKAKEYFNQTIDRAPTDSKESEDSSKQVEFIEELQNPEGTPLQNTLE